MSTRFLPVTFDVTREHALTIVAIDRAHRGLAVTTFCGSERTAGSRTGTTGTPQKAVASAPIRSATSNRLAVPDSSLTAANDRLATLPKLRTRVRFSSPALIVTPVQPVHNGLA